VNFDNEPPKLDITKPTDGSEFYGSRQRQLVIEGTTDENATININSRMVVVDNQGNFSFGITLQDGTNEFTIKAQDAAGNTTEKTLKVQYAS
jgi:bacillopeptidase F